VYSAAVWLLWLAVVFVLAGGILALFALSDYRDADERKNAKELQDDSGD